MRLIAASLILAASSVVASPPVPCPNMTPANLYILHVGQDGGCSSYDPNQPCKAGALVQFYVGTFGYNFYCGPHTFTWDFGDGTSATGLNIFHTFVSPGSYNVSVVIRNGFQQLTLTERVLVNGDIVEFKPADFSMNVSGRLVLFKIDPGDSGITHWILDLGDGTAVFFNALNPPLFAHEYGQSGHYLVTLTAGTSYAITHEIVIPPASRTRAARH